MDMEISKTDANTIIRLLTSSARIAARDSRSPRSLNTASVYMRMAARLRRKAGREAHA